MAEPLGNGNENLKPSNDPAKWTVLLYLAGDNNLSSNSISIMQELEDANPSDEVRVVACYDANTPVPKGAKYLEVNSRRRKSHSQATWALHDDQITSDEVAKCLKLPLPAPSQNTGTANNGSASDAESGLYRFLKFATTSYKSEHYALILFGHGTAVAGNTFLAEDNPPSFVRLPAFRRILREFFTADKKLDLLACDNCVMNGIELAYELKDNVRFLLGSQGLMLTVGWPYRKIIEAIDANRNASPKTIGTEILKACARRLLDFSLMERSSEQSLLDLSQLGESDSLISKVKALAGELKTGMTADATTHQLPYPVIRDAVKTARLEAQSYWDETFVDLYDFCESLLRKCEEVYSQKYHFRNDVLSTFSSDQSAIGQNGPAAKVDASANFKEQLLTIEPLTSFQRIGLCCMEVMKAIKSFVANAYYVGPELQYSHGVSVYFPWSRPENALMFDPVPGGNSSTSSNPAHHSHSFKARTAFDEYCSYGFAKPNGGDWSAMLDSFFSATLRNVRRFDTVYENSVDDGQLFATANQTNNTSSFPIFLEKTTQDTGKETDCMCTSIKNYPRLDYLSPADKQASDHDSGSVKNGSEVPSADRVSHLGWQMGELVAEVIGLKAASNNPFSVKEVPEHQPTSR